MKDCTTGPYMNDKLKTLSLGFGIFWVWVLLKLAGVFLFLFIHFLFCCRCYYSCQSFSSFNSVYVSHFQFYLECENMRRIHRGKSANCYICYIVQPQMRFHELCHSISFFRVHGGNRVKSVMHNAQAHA